MENNTRMSQSVACIFFLCVHMLLPVGGAMTQAEKRLYRDKVIGMFFHAYDNYMDYAYPADELMPLSCRGRVRGREPSRGDIDDCLGGFSLTLIDSLDTLAVIGAIKEFNDAVKLVIRDVRFNADLRVSVFETNIRVLGGLLGAHFAAEALRENGHPLLQWYHGGLVSMAKVVGDKLLPAFNTPTGIPYARINLRYGVNDTRGQTTGDSTCTACAGTMLMEFAALSRLTGNPEYELKARGAMEALWDNRQHAHNLMGSVINVNNGQWLKKDSGVGAGIDSYYEYCLKSYILLGDKEYLKRFNVHYSAIKQYVSDGPNLFEVNMNSPMKTTKRFMDSLLAFWPGLQVLWGDITSAVETHNMLYQVTIHNKFLPEAFSTEFKPLWPQHPLRPEFIESTYFLYQATSDPYYLDVGKSVADNLEKYARVPCGYAALKDVRGTSHEDRFDSYVLAETFKYLYLLFAEEEDIAFDLDDFIFTTEAHLLPLKLSNSAKREQDKEQEDSNKESIAAVPTQCPNMEIPWADVDIYVKLLNKQSSGSRFVYDLDNSIERRKQRKMLYRRRRSKDKISLKVLDFGNPDHLTELNNMGISFQFQDGGKVILAHHPNKAVSSQAGKEGKELIEEVMKIMQKAGNQTNVYEMKLLIVTMPNTESYRFLAGPAMFGPQLSRVSNYQVESEVVVQTSPRDGCSPFDDSDGISGRIPLILRGGCMFIDKVRNAERSGAIAVLIYDNISTTSNTKSETNVVKPVFPFSMSGDGVDDVNIPSLLISREDGITLHYLKTTYSTVKVLLTSGTKEEIEELQGIETSKLLSSPASEANQSDKQSSSSP